jgi:hypothetical protein
LLDVAYALVVARREGVSEADVEAIPEVLLGRERGEKRTSAEGRDRTADVGPARRAGRSMRSESERFIVA